MYLHYPEIETEFQPQIVEIIEQRLEDKCDDKIPLLVKDTGEL
jgi:hypothetical protein